MMRAYTKDEVREKFLDYVRGFASYWTAQPNLTDRRKCYGVAFSILALLDGVHMEFPSVDIAVHPHEDDMEYHKSNGENWYEPGVVFNDDCDLHEMFYKDSDR